jgi:hypothetical protein
MAMPDGGHDENTRRHVQADVIESTDRTGKTMNRSQ